MTIDSHQNLEKQWPHHISIKLAYLFPGKGRQMEMRNLITQGSHITLQSPYNSNIWCSLVLALPEDLVPISSSYNAIKQNVLCLGTAQALKVLILEIPFRYYFRSMGIEILVCILDSPFCNCGCNWDICMYNLSQTTNTELIQTPKIYKAYSADPDQALADVDNIKNITLEALKK